MKLSCSLPLAAFLVVAAGAALADEASDAQVRNVEVRKIVLAHGDSADPAQTGVFVSRVQTNGNDPVTSLQVLGSGDTAIDINDLADGETRSIEIGEDKWMDVTRDGEMLRLNLDGKEIEVPLNPAANMMLPGLNGTGDQRIEVMMLDGNDLQVDGGDHAMVFIGDDGVAHELPADGAFEWTEDGNAAFGAMSKIVVKRIGEDGGETEDVHVMAMPAFALKGAGMLPNLDELESLKGADPAVRAKVIEALQEILGKQHAVQLRVEADADAGAPGTVRVRRTDAGTPREVH